MSSYHQAFFGPDDPETRRITLDGLVTLETTLQLAKKFQLSTYQARDGLHKFSLVNTPLSRHCPKIPICDHKSKYRTLDGSCNNLQYPLWAKSFTQFQRLVPPFYADGLNELRVSIDGGELPNPREVSCKVWTAFTVVSSIVKVSLIAGRWFWLTRQEVFAVRHAMGTGLSYNFR